MFNQPKGTIMTKEKLIQSISENMPGGFFIYKDDPTGEIIYANDAMADLFECENVEEFLALVNNSFYDLVVKEELEDLKESIKLQQEGTDAGFDHIIFHINVKGGKRKYVEDFAKRVYLEDLDSYVFFVYIVDCELKFVAFDIDKITNLPGPRRFLNNCHNLFAKAKNKEEKYALLFFDFTHFKAYNMKYGMSRGDELLREIAKTLRSFFPNDNIGRLENDHFGVLTKMEGLQQILLQLKSHIDLHYAEDYIHIKIGIYEITPKQTKQLAEGLNCAQIASLYIKNNDDYYCQVYNEQVSMEKKLDEYVVNNIENAIKNGDIKVFYQPVVRTLSGALCGAEALARWIDPTYGFMPPSKFITPLENNRKIHLLDIYVIKEVIKKLSERIKQGLPVVPVSFNLSKLDFYLCDIFEIIDNEVNKYQLPHYFLNIEITESVLINDRDGMQKQIERFKEAGYHIWMDDFGSGYSSLNVLKDFDFDEIKLDMEFMRNFSDKSRSIVTSMIKMAKKINIQTLAEGVETIEQYEFLKNIGCEKVQGFLIGKPAPFEAMIKSMEVKHIHIENQVYQNYYDLITRLDFVTDSPLAIIEYESDYFNVLFANDVTIRNFSNANILDSRTFEHMLNEPSSPLSRRLRDFIALPLRTKKMEYFYFGMANNYYRFDVENVSSVKGHDMFVLRLHNITNADSQASTMAIDEVMKDVYRIYDSVALINFETNTFQTFQSYKAISSMEVYDEQNFAKASDAFRNNYIYEDDRERYRIFTLPENIINNCKKNYIGMTSSYFRSATQGNTYEWKLFSFLYIKHKGKDKYLLLVKPVAFNDPEVRQAIIKDLMADSDYTVVEDTLQSQKEHRQSVLFETLLKNFNVNIFYKDKNRRFIGASKAFLDTYSFNSLNDIIGKTDEDMNWHLNNDNYKNDEERLLKDGTPIRDAPGQCIINGIPKIIRCNKWPIYDHAKIQGLIGYFYPVEEHMTIEDKSYLFRDSLTGLLNTRGLLDCLLTYSEQYNFNERDYMVGIINITSISSIKQSFGNMVAQDTMRLAASILENTIGKDCSIARIDNSKFAFLHSIIADDHHEEIEDTIKNALKEINIVDGSPVTVYAEVSLTYASECSNQENEIFIKIISQMAQN